MARKNIQGITIEIGGDTTKLQDALKGVESKIRSTQNALRDVNKLLKMDPGNVELLQQKQRLLNETYDATKEKLQTLKDAAADMQGQLERGEISRDQFDALQREIIETEQRMESLTDEMKDFGSVAAQQVAAAGEKVKEFSDKVTDAGETLSKTVTAPIVATAAASVAAWGEVDEGMDTIIKKTGASGEALEDMQNRAKNLATQIPTDFSTAAEAVGEVNTRFGLTGDELETLSGQFIKFADLNDTSVSSAIDNVQASMAAFDMDASDAANVLDILNKAGQDTGISVDKLANDLTSNAAVLQEMGMGYDVAAGFISKLNKQGMDSSSVLSGLKKAMQNATKEGKSMQEGLDGVEKSIKNAKTQQEALSIATELFGAKSAPAMVSAIQDGRISFDEISNVVKDWGGSVTDTFEATLDPLDEFKTILNELKIVGAEIVDAAGPMIKQVADAIRDAVQSVREWWESLDPLAQETIIKAAGIAAAIGPILIVVGKVGGLIGNIMTKAPEILNVINNLKGAVTALWAVLAANPLGAIIALIAAAVAAFVVAWNTSEEFRQFWIDLWYTIVVRVEQAVESLKKAWEDAKAKAEEIWTNVSTFFTEALDGIKTKADEVWGNIVGGLETAWENVKTTMGNLWDDVTGKVKDAIETIKGFFKFEWELPKIKLPHFSIVGEFSLTPPSVPHLGVEWYRKAMDNAMLLNGATIFGAKGGNLLGGGEAGPEVVSGADTLMAMIQGAVGAGAGSIGESTLEIDRVAFGKIVYKLYNEEAKRVGVRLSGVSV